MALVAEWMGSDRGETNSNERSGSCYLPGNVPLLNEKMERHYSSALMKMFQRTRVKALIGSLVL